ncbi:MAG: YvrJ family protein [Epulopiscium sp.]|nr:YvrJ family protein [Candidatus Epulonipiscium sp.]
MEEFLSHIGNYGFPMILSIYLLVRVESKLEALTKSIYQLSQVLSNHTLPLQ